MKTVYVATAILSITSSDYDAFLDEFCFRRVFSDYEEASKWTEDVAQVKRDFLSVPSLLPISYENIKEAYNVVYTNIETAFQ